MTRAIHRPAVLLAALAVVVAGCGDDSGSPFTSAPATTDASTTTAAGGSATTAVEGTTAGATSIPGTAGELADLLDRFREVPLRTTYLSGEEADRQEITFSQDPTLDPPASAIILEDGKVITLEDRSIVCGLGGPESQCFELPASGGIDFTVAMISPFAMLALATQGITDTPGFEVDTEGITIAGRSGVCFTFSPRPILGSDLEFARQCVDDQLGFTLLLEVKEVGAAAPERVMELLRVGQPEPGDFEPTGPVVTLPTP